MVWYNYCICLLSSEQITLLHSIDRKALLIILENKTSMCTLVSHSQTTFSFKFGQSQYKRKKWSGYARPHACMDTSTHTCAYTTKHKYPRTHAHKHTHVHMEIHECLVTKCSIKFRNSYKYFHAINSTFWF